MKGDTGEMADIKSKIMEIVGDETKASEIVSSLGEFMIPKEQYNKKVGELTDLKNQFNSKTQELEAVKVSSMTEQDKFKHEMEKLTQERSALAKHKNLLEVKDMFVSKGITNLDEYSEVISGLVSEDGEQTKKIAEGVLNMIVKQTENAVTKTKEQVVNSTPQPKTSGDGTTKPAFVPKKVY